MSEQFKLGGIFTTVSVIITGVLGGLQGCSNGDPFVQELNPPAVTTTSTGATISGSAVKGLLTGADCIATNTAGIELYSSVGNESPCTSSRGRYSFQLLSNPTTPVVVTLQARTSMTQMLCDFPAGCGNGVAFGESLDLSNDFSLRAVVPTIPSTVTTQEVNISPWTEVATARAISSASSLSSVTTTQVESAYLEVASVLNNVLSLEGTSDEFDGNFFSIDLVDLAAPDQDDDIDSGEERSATLMSLASASLFNLVDTTNTSITSVVQNLSSAFSSDGEFNVNDTATGIADDNGIDLADIITGVGGVVQDIQSVLQPNAVTQLATFLNTSDLTTELSSIKSAADTLAELKESVVNVELDTTKPVNLIELAGESDFSKATELLLDLRNVLMASTEAFKTDEGDNTVLEDIGDTLELSNTNYDDALEVLIELVEAAAGMILDVSEQDTSAFTNAGCTVVGTSSAVDSIECSLSQIATTLDFPDSMIRTGTGTLRYDGATKTASNSGTLTVGSETYEISVTGTTTSGTAPLYTIEKATANLEPGDTTNPQTIAFNSTSGSTSTIEGMSSNAVLQSFTVNAQDVAIVVDEFTLLADVLATRDTTISDTLVTNFNLDGSLTIGSGISSPRVDDNNEGDAIAFRLAFKGNTNSLASSSPTTLPTPAEETEDNFIAATDVLLRLETPVTYSKVTTFSTTEQQASEKLVITLRGMRNAVKNGTISSAVFRLTTLNVGDSVVNDIVKVGVEVPTSGSTETWTFSDGTNDASIVVTLTDDNGQSSASGSVSVVNSAGESRNFGTVSANGTVSVVDADGVETTQSLALPSVLF